MKKLQIWIGVILGVCALIGTAYGGFKFYSCKADRIYVDQIKQLKADKKDLELVKADFYIYKLEQYRKYIQQRIWDIQRQYPTAYQNNSEYRRLNEELKQIDMKINAYYQKGGK